jgi:hypothetical protein
MRLEQWQGFGCKEIQFCLLWQNVSVAVIKNNELRIFSIFIFMLIVIHVVAKLMDVSKRHILLQSSLWEVACAPITK